ncbi:archaeal proteasome endopeptidase complex subunit beta [Candidatus Bathyarchaeota archaeon]|jgi:proteasome beta subunit|nr:archaeal proteasome endopeptidase complex subunit beta [Candidatus Bathyarchaeota archaeon]
MSEEMAFMPGATTVGVVCKDGVVLASERRLSYGYFVMSKTAKKTFKITDKIGTACAGLISDMQILAREVGAYVALYSYERERSASVKTAAKIMANLLFERRMFPLLTQTIIGGIDPEGPSLYVLDPIGSLIQDKYTSVGSGAEVAMGLLEAEYKDDLTPEEAKNLVTKAIKTAVARDIGSGDGVDLLTITKDGIKEESLKLA